MMHYTHTPGGIFAVASVFMVAQPNNIAELSVGLFCGAVGGLLPDIDHESSKITKKLGPIGYIISRCCSHRGITHTLALWVFLFGLIATCFPVLGFYCGCLFLGCVSHLVLDAMTPSGVPLLWPMKQNKISFMKIKTGGKVEPIVSGLLVFCNVVMIGLITKNILIV